MILQRVFNERSPFVTDFAWLPLYQLLHPVSTAIASGPEAFSFLPLIKQLQCHWLSDIVLKKYNHKQEPKGQCYCSSSENCLLTAGARLHISVALSQKQVKKLGPYYFHLYSSSLCTSVLILSLQPECLLWFQVFLSINLHLL